LLLEPYHNTRLGRPFCSPEAIIKALMLQRFMCTPSERPLAEELAKCKDIRGVFAVLGVTRQAEDASPISGVSDWVWGVSEKPLRIWWKRLALEQLRV